MTEGWSKVRLDDCARIEFGTRVTRKKDAGTIYPVFGGGGETFRLDQFNRDSCYIVSRFAMSEECVRYVDGKFFLNDSGLSVASAMAGLSQEFLDRMLLANSKRIYEFGRGTAQKNLDMSLFRGLEIPLPPLDEQKRIVAKLDEALSVVERLKANTAQSKSELDTFWQSALTQAFSQDWPMVKLREVMKLVGGGTPSKANASFWSGPIPWASVRDLKTRYLESTEFSISETGLKQSASNLISKNSVVIATRVGLGKVVQVSQPTAINQDLRALIPFDENTLQSDFIYYWYLTNSHLTIAAGTGATVQGVKLPFLENLEIPLPPLDEQKRIVAKLDEVKTELDRQREILSQKESETERLRSSILTAAFNGEL